MENLKKCPFCGKEDVIIATDREIEGLSKEQGTGYFAVNCDYTTGGCGATSGYEPTEEKAIESWNRRTS